MTRDPRNSDTVARPTTITRDHSASNKLHGWRRWLRTAARAFVSEDTTEPRRLNHFAIERKIGEGGMGVVYAARDNRLRRAVALKMVAPGSPEHTSRRRLLDEARAAAALSHPHICQIYEVGEDRGDLFIAMELLDGESLEQRLRRGPMTLPEAVRTSLQILSALTALHAHRIVHRDLKPSNVFLTGQGVKLLDFGIAQALADDTSRDPLLTQPGTIVGTPAYMAPERLTQGLADERSDLFAVAAMLFEMLSGQRAFNGKNAVETLRAVVSLQPPPLGGSAAVQAVDRIIRSGLAKRPEQRPKSAERMSASLRRIPLNMERGHAAAVSTLARVIVLPFRLLDESDDFAFLSFGLADALATALSSFQSLTVRSTTLAVRDGAAARDLGTIAAETDVDRVVLGTVHRVASMLKVSVQLVEAPSGTLLATHAVECPAADLSRVPTLVQQAIVPVLSRPLVASASADDDTPRHPVAFEYYLRAQDLSHRPDALLRARRLSERCVELDPNFAPAWAQLGRCHRLISRFVDGESGSEDHAEAALRRALELNPRLASAHKLLAYIESDTGQSTAAMVRLLAQIKQRPSDAELYAGLVHAARYCGLNSLSVAAHDEARRLDPTVQTSVEETLLISGDVDALTSLDPPPQSAGELQANKVIALGLAGRRADARRALNALVTAASSELFGEWTRYLSAWLDRQPAAMVFDSERFGRLAIEADPEAAFQEGWLLCDAGDLQRGLVRVEFSVSRGYYAVDALVGSNAFAAVRQTEQFQRILSEAARGRDEAFARFTDVAGGEFLGGACRI